MKKHMSLMGQNDPWGNVPEKRKREQMKALVTGASSGIGKDIAKYLGSKGYELILVARDESKLKEVAQEIPTKVKIEVADLSKKEEVLELWEHVKEDKIDMLINNAGFGVFGEFTRNGLRNRIKANRNQYNSIAHINETFCTKYAKGVYFKCVFYGFFCTWTINGYILCIKSICNQFNKSNFI